MVRASILVSGEGRRMRCLLDSAFFQEIAGLEIAGVVSSDPEAPALRTARNSGVAAYVVDERLFPNTGSYGLALLNMLKDIDTDLVVLAGFTPSMGPAARYYAGRTLGVFPALLPAFQDVPEAQVCAAALARGVHLTGATAYLADADGKMDVILAQKAVAVEPEDTPERLSERIFQQAQRELLIEQVQAYCASHS